MQLFKNFALLLVAIVLAVVIIPVGFAFTVAKLFFTSPKSLIKVVSSLFFVSAVSIDQLGNCSSYVFLNAILIKDDYLYPFGNEDETISIVLGRNKVINNLSATGKFLDAILCVFEKDHSVKSIGE